MADIQYLLKQQAVMEGVRRLRESEWQQIADYFLPTKNFLIERIKGQSIPRQVMTSVPQKALARFAAMFIGFLIDPVKPFIVPNVKQGLIGAGRGLKLDGDAQDYLGKLSWQVRDRMMNSRSGFRSSLSRAALELGAFGNAVIWTGRRRGFGPVYVSRPIRQCWFDIDDEDNVNRLHYQFKMPIWQVLEKYPAAKDSKKLDNMRRGQDADMQEIKLLHCVYPRGGYSERGGIATNKPFGECIFMRDCDDVVLSEGGYDDFPFAVPRTRVAEGNPYGQGFAWIALPDAMVLNQLQQDVEYGVGQRVAPAMFMPSRIMGKVDRRRGAMNYYDPKLLGFQTLQQAVQAMPAGGDVGVGKDYMQMLAQWIEDDFMIDWMKLPEHGAMTATEVNDRKQLRAVGLTGALGTIERELMGVLGDRTLAVMTEENMVGVPPEALQGVGVDWDYAGPLAMAQQQAMVDSVQRLFELNQMARAGAQDDFIDVVVFDEGLRLAANSLGLPPAIIETMEAVAQAKAQQAQQKQEQAEAQNAQTGAAAFQSGAQGLAALQGAATAGAANNIRSPQMQMAA